MSAKNKSQTQEIIAFLRKNKSITSLQAFNRFNATRLSGIIFVLRKRGFGIDTEIVQDKNRYGHLTNYAIYHLTKDLKDEDVENLWFLKY